MLRNLVGLCGINYLCHFNNHFLQIGQTDSIEGVNMQRKYLSMSIYISGGLAACVVRCQSSVLSIKEWKISFQVNGYLITINPYIHIWEQEQSIYTQLLVGGYSTQRSALWYIFSRPTQSRRIRNVLNNLPTRAPSRHQGIAIRWCCISFGNNAPWLSNDILLSSAWCLGFMWIHLQRKLENYNKGKKKEHKNW